MNPSNPSRTLRIEAITLALVAGYVDGYALRVFGIYVSFMSGNTTMAGIESGQGHFLIALIPSLAIAGFILGSFVGNWFGSLPGTALTASLVHGICCFDRRLRCLESAHLREREPEPA
jgi:uncharacterized membrane protein YoaK (UPF0700 family)